MEVSAVRTEVKNKKIKDHQSEKGFDDIASLACHVSGASMAVIASTEDGLVSFKSVYGIPDRERSKELAFCAQVLLGIESGRVQSPEFFVGLPARGTNGRQIGSLCVMDRQPRQLCKEQAAALDRLATQVASQIETSKTVAEIRKAALEEIIAALSHEINNPLAIIVGKSEMLRKKGYSGEEIARDKLLSDLMKIEKAAFRIAQLVKKLNPDKVA